MNFIVEDFKTRYVNLNSNLDADTLNNAMREFCGRSFWNFNDNLRGRIRDDGYSFSRRIEIGGSTGTRFPKLKAKVLPDADGSIVQIELPPPFASGIVAILSAVIGFVIMCAGLLVWEGYLIIIGIVVVIIFPVAIGRQNKWSRAKLLVTFANVFDLYQA